MSRERERFDEIGKKIKRENDVLLQTGGGGGGGGRRHIQLGPPGTLNIITPCAACKLLRRRCAQECPFSPYFSPHEPQKFAVVHKVFGASNVSKMLMEVAETQRADAANSLVYEANVRLRDPIYGCMGAISALQQQIQVLQAQVTAVRAEILKYKYREVNHHNHNHHHHHLHDHVATMDNNNNNNLDPSHNHLTLLSSGAVSIAVPPPELLNPTEPPTPLPPQPPPDSSVSSSMYTHPSGSEFSSISNENISYFG